VHARCRLDFSTSLYWLIPLQCDSQRVTITHNNSGVFTMNARVAKGEKVREPVAPPAPVAEPEPEAEAAVVAKPKRKPSVRWVSFDEVIERYANISRATLARWIEAAQFPAPVSFAGRVRMWDERELDEYDAMRKAARDSAKEVQRAKRREREERATKKARGET
jgi:predicted DNA-binding transcriptional regulator AlpA